MALALRKRHSHIVKYSRGPSYLVVRNMILNASKPSAKKPTKQGKDGRVYGIAWGGWMSAKQE